MISAVGSEAVACLLSNAIQGGHLWWRIISAFPLDERCQQGDCNVQTAPKICAYRDSFPRFVAAAFRPSAGRGLDEEELSRNAFSITRRSLSGLAGRSRMAYSGRPMFACSTCPRHCWAMSSCIASPPCWSRRAFISWWARFHFGPDGGWSARGMPGISRVVATGEFSHRGSVSSANVPMTTSEFARKALGIERIGAPLEAFGGLHVLRAQAVRRRDRHAVRAIKKLHGRCFPGPSRAARHALRRLRGAGDKNGHDGDPELPYHR